MPVPPARTTLRRTLSAMLLVPALVLPGMIALSSPAEAAIRKCSAWDKSDTDAPYVAIRVCVTVTRPTATTVKITSTGYMDLFYADVENVDAKTSVRKNTGSYYSTIRFDIDKDALDDSSFKLGSVSKTYRGAHGRAQGQVSAVGQWSAAGSGGEGQRLRLSASKAFRY